MTVENYLAEAGALAGLAGILAGFSLTAVIELLVSNDGRKLTTAGIVVFAAASMMFLYALIVAVLSFSAAAELNAVPSELDPLNGGAFILLLIAVYIFLAGIGTVGWLRSKVTGILTSAFAFIFACMITYAVIVVISLF